MVALVGRMPRTRARSPPELEFVTAVAIGDRVKIRRFGCNFLASKTAVTDFFTNIMFEPDSTFYKSLCPFLKKIKNQLT